MNKKIKHVAIIMDGNGRWAKQRFRPRVWGHIRGSHVVSQIIKESDEQGVEALTLYTFSTENWSRPREEVSVLFKLLKKFLLLEENRIFRNKIKFNIIGEIEGLPQETKDVITRLREQTKDHTGLKLTFAFSYGGRKEIIDSCNKFIKQNPGKEISENDFENCLYSPELGDVDLLIRTGGDKRISNFLLWQCSYAELFFTDTKWPEFSRKEYKNIIESVLQRDRRFGTIENGTNYEDAKMLSKKNKDQVVKEV